MNRILPLLLTGLALFMVLYHLVYTQYLLLGPIHHLNLHYMLALTMVFLGAMKDASSKTDRIVCGVLVLLGVYATAYIFVEFDNLQMFRAPIMDLTTQDMVVGVLLVGLGLEASRRAFGPVFPLVAICFISYAVFGSSLSGILASPKIEMPDLLVSFAMGLDSGIYGSSLAISANYIFLFVVFGSVLGVTGASVFFNQVGLMAGKKMAGGPAISAVISSALMGSITGSAMANVATTGAFTIPLMKRVGYRPEQAGAIEAAASTGGQIMPPIMGATAFVLAEMARRPYSDVMIAGLLPAILYFFSVGVYAQLQAKKLKLDPSCLKGMGTTGREFWMETPVFLVPLLLITVILIMGYTPMFTIFWALLALLLLNLVDVWRKGSWAELAKILPAFTDGAITGAKIGVTCAVLGPIITTMTKTMLGIKIPSVIALWCQGNLFLALVLTALVCIVLGMGLPTLAAYLIVAMVGVPTLVNLGVDGFSAHLFVFVFAVFSCLTPPIATSAVPAAGIAGARYLSTALEASKVGCVGFIIPFLLVFTPEIQIVGNHDGALSVLFYFCACILAVIFLGIFIVGYGVRILNLWERLTAGGTFALILGSLFTRNLYLMSAAVAMGLFFIFLEWKLKGKRSPLPAL